MDLYEHFLRQMTFDFSVFGKGRQVESISEKIKCELAELLNSEYDPQKWSEVVLLAFEGLLRTLAYDQEGNRNLRSREHVAALAAQNVQCQQSKKEELANQTMYEASGGKPLRITRIE